MSIGWLLAIVVLFLVVVALVFKPAAPEWLPLALTGMLALAIVLSPLSLKWPWAAG